MSASVPSDKSFPFRLLTLFWKSFFYHVLVLVCQLIITYWDLQIFKREAYFLAIKQLSVYVVTNRLAFPMQNNPLLWKLILKPNNFLNIRGESI